MKRVVIIGAGPAGLTAGYELLRRSKEKYEVIILEESDVTGGISKTVNCDGNRMDMGGHRFFSKEERVMDWWKELLPVQGQRSFDDKILGRECELAEGGPDPETEDRVFLKRQRISRIYYKRHFFDYPVKMNMTTIKNLGFSTTLEAGCSYLKTLIFKRKENSLEDFYINRFGRKLYSIFFEKYTEKLWGRHPSEISPDWGAQRVKGLSVLAVLKDIAVHILPIKNREVETSLIESFYYPKFGPGQMWEAAAEAFEEAGGEIHYHCQVTGFKQKGNKKYGIKDLKENTEKDIKRDITEHMAIEKVCYLENGVEKEIEADAVFSSMPLKDLVKGIEEAPAFIRDIADGLPYRDFVTVGVLVNKLCVKNETEIPTLNNIVPDCWIYVQDRGMKLGRIQIFNNWSPYMVENPEETVWIGLEYFCTEGDYMWKQSPEEWKELGRRELVQMGILSEEEPVLSWHCEKVKKAYPAYFDTYSHIGKLQEWLNTIDNLYCIGRNGQHRYNNMDHSMLTAMEAVDIFLAGSSEKTSLWKVNTEKEYHEEKGRET